MPQYEDAVADTLQLATPAPGFAWAAAQSLNESLVASDAARVSYTPTVVDGLQCSASLYAGYMLLSALQDGVRCGDACSRVVRASVWLAHSLRLTSSRRVSAHALAADAIFTSDATTAAIGLSLSDALNLSRVVSARLRYASTLGEAASFASDVLHYLGASAVDDVSFSDITLGNRRASPVVEDSLVVADELAPLLVLKVVATDVVALDSAMSVGMLFESMLSDALVVEAAFATNASFLTWAVNLSNKAVTEYSGFDFNSYAKVGSQYWAAGEDGLYRLDGDTDAGQPVAALIRSGLMKFNGTQASSPDTAYLALRGDGEVLLRISDCDNATHTYRVTHDSLRTAKAKLGRGLKLRYFSFELETMGQDFDFDGIEFLPVKFSRRV